MAESECLKCGTCCFSTLATYVRVTGDDHARLGPAADELVVFQDNRAYMKMEKGHCAALAIDLEKGMFRCTVYELRPETCRALEELSPACEGEIATKGTRPRDALVALRRKADA